MIPIPRDLWIQGLPEIPENAKINEAFADGYVRGGVAEAGRAATLVLSKVTGLKIEHWMAIDFTGFKTMVDTVGGVTIDNPVAFSYTWSEQNFHAGIWDGGSFAAGTITLDGEAGAQLCAEPLQQRARPSRATSPDRSASSGCWPRCAPSWGAAGSARSVPGWR